MHKKNVLEFVVRNIRKPLAYTVRNIWYKMGINMVYLVFQIADPFRVYEQTVHPFVGHNKGLKYLYATKDQNTLLVGNQVIISS